MKLGSLCKTLWFKVITTKIIRISWVFGFTQLNRDSVWHCSHHPCQTLDSWKHEVNEILSNNDIHFDKNTTLHHLPEYLQVGRQNLTLRYLFESVFIVFSYFYYYPAIPCLGIDPEETKTEKNTCIPLFTEKLFTIARKWKQPRYPLTDE